MSPPPLARALDPDGREVVLTHDAWRHVIAGHPELADHRDLLMRAIAEPEHRSADRRPGRERYFVRGGPSRWVRVVVDFSQTEAVVVTAFSERRDPPGWQTSSN